MHSVISFLVILAKMIIDELFGRSEQNTSSVTNFVNFVNICIFYSNVILIKSNINNIRNQNSKQFKHGSYRIKRLLW